MKLFPKAVIAILGLGVLVSAYSLTPTVMVQQALAQVTSVVNLSQADKTLLAQIRDAITDVVALKDENGNPVVWAQPNSGLQQSAASITTTAGSCYAADATARERMIKSIETNTADIYFMLDDDGSPTLTAATAPKTLHPGDEWSTGTDGYTGAIYCLAASGTQSLAKNTVR